MENVLSKLVPVLFKELEPSLLAIACRYRVPNPKDTVKGWMSRAFEIVCKFDTGDLKKKVYSSLETRELVEFNPDLHSDEDFIGPLRHYLKRSFTNHLIKIYNVANTQKKKEEETAKNSVSEFSRCGFEQLPKLMKYDNVTIVDFMKILDVDLERIKGDKTTILDVIQEKFLLAMYRHCEEIVKRGPPWDSLVVVDDVDTSNNKEFFTFDFKIELEAGMRYQLSKIICTEENPVVVMKLGSLVDITNKGTLQKRILRYLFKHKKGFPERLRARIKSRTL